MKTKQKTKQKRNIKKTRTRQPSRLELPDDLVRIILEESFTHKETSRPRQIDLMLLSKHIYDWLSPIFYRYIILSGNFKFVDGPPVFVALPPKLLALVESVCINGTYGPEELAPLRICPNLYQFSLFTWLPLDHKTVPAFLATHCRTLRRLSISFTAKFKEMWSFAMLRSPLFISLTHLDLSVRILDTDGDNVLFRYMEEMDKLTDLTDLTHLSLRLLNDRGPVSLDRALNLLLPKFPPNLSVIIIWYGSIYNELTPEWVLENQDPRLVFRTFDYIDPSDQALLKLRECELVLEIEFETRDYADWADPMLNPREADIWTLAEELLKKRAIQRAARS